MGTTNLIQQMVPFIGMGFTIGSVVFQVGKQSEKLDIVNLKVEAQEKKTYASNEKICDIYNVVSTLKTELDYVKKDVHDIKETLKIMGRS